MASSGDPRVLSYGDVLLRESDVATLGPRQWLNDNILEFYFEFLSRRLRDESHASGGPALAGRDRREGDEAKCRQEKGESGGETGIGVPRRESGASGDALLMGPSVAFWVQSCGSTQAADEAVKPLGLRDKAVSVNLF